MASLKRNKPQFEIKQIICVFHIPESYEKSCNCVIVFYRVETIGYFSLQYLLLIAENNFFYRNIITINKSFTSLIYWANIGFTS